MRDRSARGRSTPTSRPTEGDYARRLRPLIPFAIPLAAIYVIEAFVAPAPWIRIALRTLPILPIAVWTLWFDRSRPFEQSSPALRTIGRFLLLLLVMAFSILVLGLGLNWLYDPARVL
jgi:hypothetical protein